MSDEEPASKRIKTMQPDEVVDVLAGGDVLLVIKGIAGVEKP